MRRHFCTVFGLHKWEIHRHPKYVTEDYRECLCCGKKQMWIEGHF